MNKKEKCENSFFLTEQSIERYQNTPGYELTKEQLQQEWKMDPRPLYKQKNCYNFHAKDGCYIEIAAKDIHNTFTCGELRLPYGVDTKSNCDFKSAWKETPKYKSEEGDLAPGDLVLVREDESDLWECHVFEKFFKHRGALGYLCKNNVSYDYCIPFKGNEHLLDRKD